MIEIAAMLASQFGDRGIRSFSVQPGTVLTEQLAVALGDGNFDSDDFTPPEYAARTMVWLATAPEATAMNGALICAPEFALARRPRLSRYCGAGSVPWPTRAMNFPVLAGAQNSAVWNVIGRSPARDVTVKRSSANTYQSSVTWESFSTDSTSYGRRTPRSRRGAPPRPCGR